MSKSITPEQQAEIQQLQQMSQQLNTLHQNYLQMESRKRELERTIATLATLEESTEVYRSMGQILFKTSVTNVNKDLNEEVELLGVRITKSKKQIEELDKRVKDREAQIRASIQ